MDKLAFTINNDKGLTPVAFTECVNMLAGPTAVAFIGLISHIAITYGENYDSATVYYHLTEQLTEEEYIKRVGAYYKGDLN